MRAAVPIRYIAWGLCALAVTACGRAPEGVVDLAGRPWQARPGFTSGDRSGTEAAVVERRPPLLLDTLGSQPGRKAREYAVSVTFATTELNAGTPLYGLLIPSVGESAEIYLNGRLVAGRVSFDKEGGLAARKVRRRWLVPLPEDAVRRGVNRLVFHVAGDAPLIADVPNVTTGFENLGGYYVGDYETLRKMNADWAAISLVGFYAVAGLFALALALMARARTLVMVGAFALLAAANTAAGEAFVLDAFPETTVLGRVQFATLFLAAAAFLGVFRALIGRGAGFVRNFAAFWVSLALLAAVAPYPAVLLSVRVWQVSALAAFVVLVALMVQTALTGNREVAAYVPALAVLSAAAAWDTAMSLFYVSDLRLAPLGALLFIGALGVDLGARFLRIHRAAETADAALIRAQERMTGFFNAMLEAVCLRRGNIVVDVNPAFTRLFGYARDEVAGGSFIQLFAAESQAALAGQLEYPAERQEATAVRRDGATFCAELEHRALAVDEQALVFTAIRDITQRKADEQKLRERNLELEALNQRMVERELRMIDLKREIRALGGGDDGTDRHDGRAT